METNQKTIIAMKGHPFTGKTSVAKAIATWFRLPILFIDNMLDVLSHDYCSTDDSVPSCQQESDYLHDLALDMACRIAKAQLETVKQSHCVIIDGPLSSVSQLHRLIGWAKAVRADKKLRLLIIECYRQNEYAWEMKFEEERRREQSNRQLNKWYKPTSWDDVEKSIKNYDTSLDDVIDNDVPGVSVSKLVLDPFTDVNEIDLFLPVPSQAPHLPPFFEAVRYFMTHEKQDDELSTMLFSDWRLVQRSDLGKGQCKAGHSLTRYIPEAELGLQGNKEVCASCEDQVTSGPAYACEFCSLALHKACAELVEEKNVRNRIVYYEPPEGGWVYQFPKRYVCSTCKEEGKMFSYGCESCVFESHLKCRWLPTIVHIEGHDHPLSIQLNQITAMADSYNCEVCGISGVYGSYCCKICDLYYHSECVKLRSEVEYEHSGYDHPMKLIYGAQEELEDYICDVCAEQRNPKCWFYYCEDCEYAAHTFCVCKDEYQSILHPFSDSEE